MSLMVVTALMLASAASTQDLAACAKIEDASKRLACFDAIAAQTATPAPAPEAPSRPEAPTVSVPAEDAAPVPAQSAEVDPDDVPPLTQAQIEKYEAERRKRTFGFALWGRDSEEVKDTPQEITAKVAKVRFAAYGNVVVTLENGQVWRQLDSDAETIRPRKAERIVDVTVRERRFGGYRMFIEPLGKSILVRREK